MLCLRRVEPAALWPYLRRLCSASTGVDAITVVLEALLADRRYTVDAMMTWPVALTFALHREALSVHGLQLPRMPWTERAALVPEVGAWLNFAAAPLWEGGADARQAAGRSSRRS